MRVVTLPSCPPPGTARAGETMIAIDRGSRPSAAGRRAGAPVQEGALPAGLRLLDAVGDDPVDACEDAPAESCVLLIEESTVEVVGYLRDPNLHWGRP